MGTADAILDLVSSGTTLRENNLKEISGGAVLSSQVSYLSTSVVFILLFRKTDDQNFLLLRVLDVTVLLFVPHGNSIGL